MLLNVVHGSVVSCFLFFAKIACRKLSPCSVVGYAFTTNPFFTTGISAIAML